ncbi:MAG: hypothetical protein ABIL16_07150 [candidate division WOR-3 bacterium]
MFYTSVYLSLSPDDRADRPPRFIVKFKTLVKRFKEFLKEKGLDEGEFKGVYEDFDKIEDFLSNPKNLESEEGIPVRGIAIFSNGSEGYWEVVQLPYVIRNSLVVDVEPYKRGILAVETEFGKNLVVDFGKKHFYVYMVEPYSLRTLAETPDFTQWAERPATFKYAAGNIPAYRTTGTKNFEMLKMEEESRVAKFVANEIFEIYKRERFDNLFLSSLDRKLIPMVVSYLHTYVKHTYRGELNLSHPTNKNEVYNVLLDKIAQMDREEENRLAARFEEMLAIEMAVKGLQPAIDMALLGNVETLIVDVDFSKEGFICHPSGYYGVFGECPSASDRVVLTPDITNKLIEHVLSLGGRVEMANTDRLRNAISGTVGAILRWKIEAKV